MPACIAHYLFAGDVLERLGNPATDLCLYHWGAQGPDFLLCHRYFQTALAAVAHKTPHSLKEYGSALHCGSPVATLNALRDFVLKAPAYRSYAMGFLCHYALDSTAHPYVNARAEAMAEERPHENPGTMHCEIEAAWDAIVLRWKTGKLPSEVKLGDTFPKNEGAQRKIACLYRDLIFKVYGEDISEEELYQSTRDAHLVFSACTDRTGLKRRLLSRLEKNRPSHITSHLVPITEDPEEDFANTAHREWVHNGETHTEDLFQLYDQALELAVKLCGEFDTADFKALTGERPFG